MVDRLFQIVYLLMEKQQITAKELAQRFEVSERTIYRDLDKLVHKLCAFIRLSYAGVGTA